MKKSEDPLESIIRRETLFRGSYLHLEALDVRLPDGRIGHREIVRVRDAVAVLPMDEDGNVYLVRQHRPAIDRTLLEIPAGLIEEGEDAHETASRECEEETGYKPRVVEPLITYAHAEGYSTGFITLFLGTGLEKTGKIHLDATEYVEQVCLPFETLVQMVKKNEIIDSKTILSVVLTETRFLKNE